MFDGSYRSRRDVNLGGGGSRRRGGGANQRRQNKTSLLEDTRLQREARRKQQLKEKSSKLIQRHYRGYKSRCTLIQHLQQQWKQYQLGLQQQGHPVKSSSSSITFSEVTLILSMLLSLPNKDKAQRNILLLEHAKNIQYHNEQAPHQSQESNTITSCSSARIVQATLERMMNPHQLSTSSVSIPVEGASSSNVLSPGEVMRLYLVVLEYHLSTLPTQTTAVEVQQQQQQQQQQYVSLLKRLGGTSGSLKLFHCTQQWLWWDDKKKNNTDCNEISSYIRDELWKWTCSILPLLNDDHDGKAIMGAILFGKKGLLDNNKQNEFLSLVDYNSIHQCFRALVQVITTTTSSNNSTDSNNTATTTNFSMTRTIHQTLKNRETIVLTNALTLLKQQQEQQQQNSSFSSPTAAAATKKAILKFIFHVLQTNPDLALVTSLVVKGENIENLILYDKKNNMSGSSLGNMTTMQQQEEDEDDLSDEDDVEMLDENNNPDASSPDAGTGAANDDAAAAATTSESQKPKKYKSSSTGPTTTSAQQRNRHLSYRSLTKKDLQTISKLDKAFMDQIQQWRKDTLSAVQEKDFVYRQSLVSLALQIGNANMWLQQLNIVSETNNSDKNDIKTSDSASNEANENSDDFLGPFLALLLQGITGVKLSTSASSPFLSQLAFGKGSIIIENLWKQITQQSNPSSFNATTCLYMIVFCDIFAQSLIAMTDDNFLQQYTTAATMTTTIDTPVVLAEDIIVRLKGLLHELYWTRPVTVHDIHLAANNCTTSNNTTVSSSITLQPAQQQLGEDEDHIRALRGRLLLSGTKCWNSLYERWCRLVRHAPFCDESAWWFPHLATRDGYGAVVDMHENIVNGGDDEDDNMFNAGSQQRRRRQRQRQQQRQYSDMVLEDEDEVHDDNSVVSMDIGSSSSEDDEMGTSSNNNGGQQQQSNVDAESDALANSFRDPKMARILTCIPQALPFDRRVRLFHSLLTADKLKTQDETSEFRMAMLMMMRGEDGGELDESGIGGGRERVEIHRDNLYKDSMNQLNQLGPRLKRKVQVSFINQHGTSEAGIDGGGVFKEFVDDLIRDAFSSVDNNNKSSSKDSSSSRTSGRDRSATDASPSQFLSSATSTTTKRASNSSSSTAPSLFSVTPLETLTVNSAFALDDSMLPHYEFLGRVLGKAVYESILVEPQFCLPFLNQLLGKRNSLEDLKNFDQEYYNNIVKLLSLNEDEISSLGLTFELTSSYAPTSTSAAGVIELIPNGQHIPVTKQNVIHYIHRVANHKLNIEGSKQTKAFLRGFRDLIPASWVRLFSSVELQKLISGDDSIRGIDVPALQRTIQYAAGYHPSQPIIRWLWEVVNEFTPAQQRLFLKFMTSCSRQPLLGFQSLEPVPCIQQIRLPDHLFNERQYNNDMDDDGDIANTTMYKNTPLPTSSTCMNLLKLPNYRSKELLRKKLLDAIESGAGFELT